MTKKTEQMTADIVKQAEDLASFVNPPIEDFHRMLEEAYNGWYFSPRELTKEEKELSNRAKSMTSIPTESPPLLPNLEIVEISDLFPDCGVSDESTN